MMGITGRVAFVTGSGAGIGRETALTLGSLGASVGVVDVNADDAAKVVAELTGVGVRASYAVADIAEPTACHAAVTQLTATLGAPQVLVNNAGISPIGSMRETTAAELQRTFTINAVGALNMVNAALDTMDDAPGGRIVNVASWLGQRRKPMFGAYSASKSALISLTETLALELAPRGITVNAVLPGAIGSTPMREKADAVWRALGQPTAAERAGTIPLHRLGTPRDVALAIAFLCSDAADYITGHCLNVDGGLAVATA